MPSIRRTGPKNQPRVAREAQQTMPLDEGTVTTPVIVAMIQALIPLGLRAVEDALLREVAALAGRRYARDDGRPEVVRWGAQRGSIYLADQKLPITVPRVRDRQARREVPLATYAALQTPRTREVGLFRRVLGGLSCRDYEAAAETVPEAFGLARSSVSRRFIRESAHELPRLQERRLDDAQWPVLVLDGKSFAGDQLVLALGVTTTGEKRILGLVQTASENKRVITSFLRELVQRGFPLDRAVRGRERSVGTSPDCARFGNVTRRRRRRSASMACGRKTVGPRATASSISRAQRTLRRSHPGSTRSSMPDSSRDGDSCRRTGAWQVLHPFPRRRDPKLFVTAPAQGASSSCAVQRVASQNFLATGTAGQFLQELQRRTDCRNGNRFFLRVVLPTLGCVHSH